VTPLDLDGLRSAATMAHAVSSLGLLIHSEDQWLGVVSWHDMNLQSAMFQLNPCAFRRLIVDHAVNVDQCRSWFGEAAGRRVGVRFVEMTDCTRSADGVVWCRVDNGDEIHAIVTVLDPASVRHLVDESITSACREGGTVSVTVELTSDEELGTTLVYVRTSPECGWTAEDARSVVSHVALVTFTEELTRAEAPWRSIGLDDLERDRRGPQR
jgi:hypothetical protein